MAISYASAAESAALKAARKVVDYFDNHNKNLTRKQDEVIDELREAIGVIDKIEMVDTIYADNKRYRAQKRLALDGKTWWCVWDAKKAAYSTNLGLSGKYRTERECKTAIVARISKHGEK